ncbi:hypothetical protein PG911_10245 [Tenacibaculum ovolyticum]|uniref:imm11 family protein n=1 Tax=Tenacibaculum ovolyticum TaxID=104270 RepID=UPI0022F3D9C2|nr:DUF1629 domain-containing protein [Tenacibaculum ovolyticum]WBX75037.1 hypothetical protein PG911_10245 [Tenacibaculum ovolyticum]
MYYQLSEFYKRDVSFVFNEETNGLDYFGLMNGDKVNYEKMIYYDVDKLDKYINNYDILPTMGAPLVSEKFKNTFNHLLREEIDFFEVEIKDEKGNVNKDFYCFNIINSISCMDNEKSIVEKTRYGTISIKKLYIEPNSLKEYSIVRMEEHKSHIIVSKEFKERCEEANLKGIEFIEEGHSIYTDL